MGDIKLLQTNSGNNLYAIQKYCRTTTVPTSTKMRTLILVTVILSNIFLPQVSSLTCFNCGYLELPDGQKVNVTEDFGKIPFCEDFTQNEENTIEAYPGGCCSAFKVKVKNDHKDEVMFLSRHGTANDEDEVWANFTCGVASPGYTCKDEHIRQDGVDDDGIVCHCYDEFCNKDVPTPDDNSTPTARTTTSQNDYTGNFNSASYFNIPHYYILCSCTIMILTYRSRVYNFFQDN